MATSPVFEIPLPDAQRLEQVKLFYRNVQDDIQRIAKDYLCRDIGRVATGHVRMAARANDTDTVTVTVNSAAVIYEFDDTAAVTAGNILVARGATAAEGATNLAAAITTNQGSLVTAVVHATDTTVVDIALKSQGITFSLATNAPARITVQDNGEETSRILTYSYQTSRTVTAEDVTRTRVRINTGMTTIRNYLFRIRTSATNNTEIAYTGTIAVSGGVIEFPIAAGEPANTRVIDLICTGS